MDLFKISKGRGCIQRNMYLDYGTAEKIDDHKMTSAIIQMYACLKLQISVSV